MGGSVAARRRASSILLYDAHLGGSEHPVSYFPAGLHDCAHRVVLELLRLLSLGGNGSRHYENSIVVIGVELLVDGVELQHIELAQDLVHHSRGHLLTLHHVLELLLQQLDVLHLLHLVQVHVLEGQGQRVPHVEELLRELLDGKNLAVLDLLPVSLHCVVVLSHLVDQLLLEFLDLLALLVQLRLVLLDRLVLVGDQRLHLLDVFSRELVLIIRCRGA
mmetsp:Transcript_14821/g.25206  ORF Transcript_14821/g.25206 Transcript_14821/m.25206 type:complete len:219 (+) Transcript_14821:26-682(+)